MNRNNDIWQSWGRRFRNALKEKGTSLGKCAADMGQAESTLRSWTNGTRQINLGDFFRLCYTADLDPCLILFGAPLMSQELRESINEATATLLKADPLSNPHYGAMMTKIRKAAKK